MNTNRTRAPRNALIDRLPDRRDGRSSSLPGRLVAAGASAALAIAFVACSPGASIPPVGSFALPSVNASAVASAAAGAALAALDQVDAAVASARILRNRRPWNDFERIRSGARCWPTKLASRIRCSGASS